MLSNLFPCMFISSLHFQLLGDGNSIEAAIDYLEELETNLEQADNIYDVRDEVRIRIRH